MEPLKDRQKIIEILITSGKVRIPEERLESLPQSGDLSGHLLIRISDVKNKRSEIWSLGGCPRIQ